MATISVLRDRLLKLQGREVDIAVGAIKKNEDVLPDFVASQLAQGVMKDGEKSDFTYSPFTIAVKKTRSGLSSVTSHLTNYDTGESYRQLYAKVKNSEIEFGTTTDKEESISDRMDGKAFGLTPDNKEEFVRQHVQQDFIKMIKDELKLP